MKRRETPLLDVPGIYAWAHQNDFAYISSSRFVFVLRALAPSICPQVLDYSDATNRTVINRAGWSRDCWEPRTLAALHLFDRGGELYELGQIGRPGPRHTRPSRFMLNDCPIVLNDPFLEQLLSCLHGLRSRLTSPRPVRVPLPERVETSSNSSLDFDTASYIAAYYRWLCRHHPDTLLREPDGKTTFPAAELEQRFGDELDWADRVAVGEVVRPRQKRRSVFSDRDFRIRRFVGYMRYKEVLGMKRHEAVDLVVEIARAFPGRYPLSRENVETILDRRPSDIS